MALTEHYTTKFEDNCFYHVYNRTVDKKPLFKNEGNYQFFLKQYDHYLSDVLDTYAFCLLGNHFHLLVRIQDLTTFKKLSNLSHDGQSKQRIKTTHDIVSHQFRKFFQSYAMAFNKQHDRIGTLFQTPFKRALVDSDQYYTQLVYYIHSNPQLHRLVDNYKDWQWSSYGRILTDRPSKLKKQEVIQWFGSPENYKQFHAENQGIKIVSKYLLEDE